MERRKRNDKQLNNTNAGAESGVSFYHCSMKRIFLLAFVYAAGLSCCLAQWNWKNVDGVYEPLPKGMHVFTSTDATEGKPNIAYYVTVDLHNRSLQFTTATGNGRRLTPAEYFIREEKPLLVMNCTFFEFVGNTNLNVVIKDGQLEAYQVHSIPGKGKDTLTYRHSFGSAIGITKNRKADVAWLYTDSAGKYAYASQQVVEPFKDSVAKHSTAFMLKKGNFHKWKMQTATGGGPILLQHGEIQVTNEAELKFTGKAITDKHPRTAMGYTKDGRLILLVIEGRFPGKAEGATLVQAARMLKELGCEEALNLDGGGSSCLLINGKQTIAPSDKEGERPVPAVFLIKQ